MTPERIQVPVDGRHRLDIERPDTEQWARGPLDCQNHGSSTLSDDRRSNQRAERRSKRGTTRKNVSAIDNHERVTLTETESGGTLVRFN